jgi:DNA polymerase III sliding clamp (beta) subunit (PCNA family)
VSFSVKGEEFFRLIDGITDDTLNIELKEGKIKVRSKTTTSSMATVMEDQNTLPEIIETVMSSMGDWKPLPKSFLDGVSLCAFSASPDLSAGVKACVAIKDNLCYATDGARVSRFLMEDIIEEENFNIFSKEAMELAKFPVIEYCIHTKWGHFRTEDGVTFSTSFIQGELPTKKIDSIFKDIDSYPSIELPSELKSVLDNVTMLASDLTDKSGRATYLHIEDNEITVKASNDLGWVEKTLRCKYDGEAIDIGINNRFLSQILQKSTTLAWNEKTLFFSSGEFFHALMQLKDLGE